MSTIKSSAENLTLNADGSGNDIIFQSNGSNVATLDQAGLLTATTFSGTGATPSIADGGNATAITINSEEDVNIGETGTPYPDYGKLHVKQLVGGRYVATFRHDGNTDDSVGIAIVTGKNTGSSGVIAAQFKDGDGNDVGKIYHTGTGLYYNTGASGGIEFTNGGAANTLDDYEEGTWTAGLSGTTADTISNTEGFYTKIGNVVYVYWYSSACTLASSTGAARITGLPFIVSSNGYSTFGYAHGNAVDGDTRGGFFGVDGTVMDFVDKDSTASSTFINGSAKYIMVSGFYRTESS